MFPTTDTTSVIVNRGFLQPGDIFNPHRLRPYINSRGEACVSMVVGTKPMVRDGKVVTNSAGAPIYIPVLQEKKIHQNALLRKYEWEAIDAAVLDVMRQPLMGIQDLINAGLTKTLGGLGTSISTYEQLSDMTDADVSMTVTPKKGEGGRVGFTPQSVPIPVISKPFSLDLRTLEASRKVGESLDVTQARVATLKVREALEDMLFNGSPTIQVESFKIYGYTNAPHRISGTAASFGGGDFATDGNAHKTFTGMMAALVAKGFYGPYGVYVSPTQYSQLLALTGTNLSETQLSVILRTIPDLKFVKRASRLADGISAMVQLTAEVVDLAIGQDATPLSWTEFGGLMSEFRVLMAAAPRIKFDSNNACGVCIATSC